MTRKWIAWMTAAAAAAAGAGCNGGQTIDASSGAPRLVQPTASLVAQARPPVPDLPVPFGFKLDEGASRNYDLAGARLVDHVYKGSAPRLQVKRFYEEQMPINRWSLVTAMFITGEVLLDFEKESERCHIIVGKGDLFHPTVIRVKLWTSGRIPDRAGGKN